MASKRSISPGPKNIMKEIMKLIAEPILGDIIKKREAANIQQHSEVINHDYCDECSGGGEIVCCDNCPRSYHINCHIPTIKKLRDGEWFCRMCAINGNDTFSPKVPINDDTGKAENDDICQYEYTDQVDMLPSLVKKIIGNCGSSKLTELKASMDLTELKPSIDLAEFKASVKRLLSMNNSDYTYGSTSICEVPIQRKYNVKLPVRKQLDKLKMIRKNDRCCVCKRGVLRGRLVQCHYCSRLYHLNCLDPPIRDWDHNMRWICPAHNKFYELAYPNLFSPDREADSDAITMKRSRCELTSPTINTFFNIPSHVTALYKKSEVNIPKTAKRKQIHMLCHVATSELELINSENKTNCDESMSNDDSSKFLTHQHLNKLQKNIDDVHFDQPIAFLSCLSLPITFPIYTTSFDIGKSRNNNLCLQPYISSCECVSEYHATITFDNEVRDFLVLNHSRHGIIVDNVSYFGSHQPVNDPLIDGKKEINNQVRKYINKRRKAVQKENNYSFSKKKMTLKCNDARRRFDYYSVKKCYMKAFIKHMNETYPKVQCKCSRRLLPKDGYGDKAVLREESILLIGCMTFKFTYNTCTKEIPEVYEVGSIAKQDEPVGNKPLNGTRLKSQPGEENLLNLMNDSRNEPSLITINGHCYLEDTDSKNPFNEQNNTSTSEINNSECHGFSYDDSIIGLSNTIIMHNNDKTILDNTLYSSSDTPCLQQLECNKMNGKSSKALASFGNDLIQEIVVSEEFVYEIPHNRDDNSPTQRISDAQELIIEEIIVVENKNDNRNELSHFNVLQPSSSTEGYSVSNCNLGDIKTEHLYARGPSYSQETIVISDDDEDEHMNENQK